MFNILGLWWRRRKGRILQSPQYPTLQEAFQIFQYQPHQLHKENQQRNLKGCSHKCHAVEDNKPLKERRSKMRKKRSALLDYSIPWKPMYEHSLLNWSMKFQSLHARTIYLIVELAQKTCINKCKPLKNTHPYELFFWSHKRDLFFKWIDAFYESGKSRVKSSPK